MRRLDSYSLGLLVSVAQSGSIARAAAREHIAPSALSRRIADLEAVLGVPLLVRSPQGITLTEAGTAAVQRVRAMQEDLQALVREVQGLGGRIAGTVRLHACPAVLVGYLPERLKEFIDRHREVQVSLHEGHGSELIRACVDGRADLCVSERADAPATVESRYFAHDPLVVELPAHHPLARRSKLRLAEVLAHPLVVVHRGGHIDQMIREHATRAEIPLRECVALNSFDAASRMVEAGYGLAIKPRRVAEMYGARLRLVSRPLKEAWAGNEQHIYCPKITPRPPAIQALLETLGG